MNYNKIKDLARDKKISLKELASRVDISETGLHHSIRSKVMRIDVLEKIASVLDVNICVFFGDRQQNSSDTIELKKQVASLNDEIMKNEKYIKVLEEHIETLKLLHKKGL